MSPSRMRYGNVSFYLRQGGVLSESSDVMFEYESSGVVVAMQPRSGPVQGGTEVTIIGQGMRKRGMIYCHFGSDTVVARVLDSSRVACASPAQAEGRVPLDLYDGDERLSGHGLAFEYRPAYILTNIQPSHGPHRGGTLVSVKGRGLSEREPATCSIGGLISEGTVVDSGLFVLLV